MKRTSEDIAWSDMIRKRAGYTCEKCGKYYGPKHRGLHAAHIYSKGGHPATRHDLENGVALCTRCHLYWAHYEPIEFADWLQTRMGKEALGALEVRAKRVA